MNWLAEDFTFYFSFADNFFQGLIPYKDYFPDQFPGAFLVYLLPRFFTSDFYLYVLIFSFLMGALFFIHLFILVKKWEKTKKEKTWGLFLILSSALILPLALMRFDLVPTILAFLALIFLLKNSSFWPEIFLALGTVVKVFPGFLLPLFVLHFWLRREKERAMKGVLIYFLVMAVFLALFVLPGGIKGLLYVFNYHLLRPIEVGSLPASVLFFGVFLGKTVNTFNNFFSWNVTVLGWDEIVAKISSVLWLSTIFLSYFWFYLKTKTQSSPPQREFIIIKACLLVILVFMAFNKVFSPQYLIWPWPFVLWFLLYLPRKKTIILGSLWCLILFLTMINLVKFWELITLNQSVILNQILRNVLYLVFLGGIFVTHAEKFPSHKKERS